MNIASQMPSGERNPAVPESETPANSENPTSKKEVVVPTAQMLTLTEKMRGTAARQTRCEEFATKKNSCYKGKIFQAENQT